jgi:hypothetical protein
LGRSNRQWISEEIARARQRRRKQGHDLNSLQEGIVSAVAGWDIRREPSSLKVLEEIKAAMETEGQWLNQEEWRISTWFINQITRRERDGTPCYQVSVECDQQKLCCWCPTIERAYAYMRLYQAIIVDQFYSIGPPWAAKSFGD